MRARERLMEHDLRRPIWSSLTTRRRDFAVGAGRARRFRADVGPFAASEDESTESLAALADLVADGDHVVLLQADPILEPPGLTAAMRAEGVRMIWRADAAPSAEFAAERLGDADAAEMIALATLTRPGPFLRNTHRLGEFLGVRIDGRLAAMAGERFRQPGFAEVSGVCVHPDFRGRGLAGALSLAVVARILARGETPYLHAFADNAAAIRLYEKLGFRHDGGVHVAALARSGA